MSEEINSHSIASFHVALNTLGAYVASECNIVRPKLLIDTDFICISVATSA